MVENELNEVLGGIQRFESRIESGEFDSELESLKERFLRSIEYLNRLCGSVDVRMEFLESREIVFSEPLTGVLGNFVDESDIGVGDLGEEDVYFVSSLQDVLASGMVMGGSRREGGSHGFDRIENLVANSFNRQEVLERVLGGLPRHKRQILNGFTHYIKEYGREYFEVEVASRFKRLYTRKFVPHLLREDDLVLAVSSDESLCEDVWVRYNVLDGTWAVLNGRLGEPITYLTDKWNSLVESCGRYDWLSPFLVQLLKTKFPLEPHFTALEELERLDWEEIMNVFR